MAYRSFVLILKVENPKPIASCCTTLSILREWSNERRFMCENRCDRK